LYFFKKNSGVFFISLLGFLFSLVGLISLMLINYNGLSLKSGLFALFISVVTGGICWILTTLFFHRFQIPSCRILLVTMICGVLCSFVMVEIISFRIKIPHELVIRALGEKQKDSKGREVWLIGRLHDFHEDLKVKSLQLDSGWQLKDGDIVSWRSTPSVARWRGKIHSAAALTFLTHQYSGKVEVSWDGEPVVYDLYSSERGVFTVDLSKIRNIYSWYLFKGAFILLLSLFFLMFSMIFFSKRKNS